MGMNPYPKWDQALLRGKYSVVCAYVEHNGLQIRADYLEVEKHKDAIGIAAAKDLEARYNYDVYYFKQTKKKATGLIVESVHWSAKKFDMLIKRMDLHKVWPKFTAKGEASTDDSEAFEPMAKLHPELEPLRQCRKLLLTLSKAKSCIGADNNNRFPVMPFGTVTGRNNHPASKFILGRPHCFRYFIAPRPGYALVHTDIVAAEDGLAAGFSQDPRKVEIYASGKDSHLEFGKLAKLIPQDAERRNPDGTVNKEIERQRGIFKVANLAIQFGAGGVTVANNCGIPKWQGERIVADHRRVFAHYWHWAETQISHAQKLGYIQTSLGWTMAVDESTPRNLILDFPQQAGCAEVLRVATIVAVERGLGKYLAAMQHDAAYLFCPENEAEDVARVLDECFAEASLVVLGEDNPVQLRVDTHIICYPDHYEDDKGQELYEVIMRSLAEVREAKEEVAA
jgi:DNA polymerase I-like protein with 3'-5' exonuclease and polymerase domains